MGARREDRNGPRSIGNMYIQLGGWDVHQPKRDTLYRVASRSEQARQEGWMERGVMLACIHRLCHQMYPIRRDP